MKKETIFGREKEIKILDALWDSDEADFLAVYGRRRVGKTHLIREYFADKKCTYFEMTGQKDGGDDGIITLCEMKYSEKPFLLDKAYAKEIVNKMEVFATHFPTKKQTSFALITTTGAKPSIWAEELVENIITLTDLMRF